MAKKSGVKEDEEEFIHVLSYHFHDLKLAYLTDTRTKPFHSIQSLYRFATLYESYEHELVTITGYNKMPSKFSSSSIASLGQVARCYPRDFGSVDKASDWEVWPAHKEKQARTNLLLYMAWRYLNSGKAAKSTMLFSIECPKDPEAVKRLFSRSKFYGIQDQDEALDWNFVWSSAGAIARLQENAAAIQKEPRWAYLVDEVMYNKVRNKLEQLQAEPATPVEDKDEEVVGTHAPRNSQFLNYARRTANLLKK